MRIRLLLALLLASCMLLSMLTTAQNKQTCTCQCLGEESSAAVLKSGGEPKCQQQCARTCGGFTDCPTASGQKCSDCCDTYCNDGEKGYGGTYSEECKVSCKSACDFRKLVNGIRDIIYAAAGIVGALMLIIHGIRLAVSRDPQGRDDAKSSMWHVIIALIIIALAASLVDLFINIGLKPAPVGTSGTSGTGWDECSECQGSMCTLDECMRISGTTSVGCYYIKGAPQNACQPCKSGVTCDNYIQEICTKNPCKIPFGCEFKDSRCIQKAASGADECLKCQGETCTLDECMRISDTTSTGCYYIKAALQNACQPCKSGATCDNYIQEICAKNPCKIVGGCKPVSNPGWNPPDRCEPAS